MAAENRLWGAVDSFEIRLGVAPSGPVAIALSSSDRGEGKVSPSSVTFTPDDYDQPRQVEVTGLDDDIDDGNVSYQVVLAPAFEDCTCSGDM